MYLVEIHLGEWDGLSNFLILTNQKQKKSA